MSIARLVLTTILALGVSGVVAGVVYATPVPVSLWHADGDATDSIGSNDGILQNGAGYGPGISGSAFSLDGVDDYVEVPDSPSLNFGTDDFSVDLWVNFDDPDNGEQILIEQGQFSYLYCCEGWSLIKLRPGDGRGSNGIMFGGKGATRIPGSGLLSYIPSLGPNEWHHVAVTRVCDTFSLYWDGALVDSATEVLELDSTVPLSIGRRYPPAPVPPGFFGGLIDEVSISVGGRDCGGGTKADILSSSGVPGKGIDSAPGLDKSFNEKSKAAENAGKK